MFSAALLALVLTAEPARLQLSVQAGYAQQFGSGRSNVRASDVIVNGGVLGLDARYRVFKLISVGGYFRFLKFNVQPSASAVLLANQFQSGELFRGGALVGVDHSIGFLRLTGDLALGWQTSRGFQGPTGHVELSALWAPSRLFGIGLFAEALVTQDLGRTQTVCFAVSSACTSTNPQPYAWLSMGVRSAFSFL